MITQNESSSQLTPAPTLIELKPTALLHVQTATVYSENDKASETEIRRLRLGLKGEFSDSLRFALSMNTDLENERVYDGLNTAYLEWKPNR